MCRHNAPPLSHHFLIYSAAILLCWHRFDEIKGKWIDSIFFFFFCFCCTILSRHLTKTPTTTDVVAHVWHTFHIGVCAPGVCVREFVSAVCCWSFVCFFRVVCYFIYFFVIFKRRKNSKTFHDYKPKRFARLKKKKKREIFWLCSCLSVHTVCFFYLILFFQCNYSIALNTCSCESLLSERTTRSFHLHIIFYMLFLYVESRCRHFFRLIKGATCNISSIPSNHRTERKWNHCGEHWLIFPLNSSHSQLLSSERTATGSCKPPNKPWPATRDLHQGCGLKTL